MNKKIRKIIAGALAGALTAFSNVGPARAIIDVSKAFNATKKNYVTLTELLNAAEVKGKNLAMRLRDLAYPYETAYSEFSLIGPDDGVFLKYNVYKKPSFFDKGFHFLQGAEWKTCHDFAHRIGLKFWEKIPVTVLVTPEELVDLVVDVYEKGETSPLRFKFCHLYGNVRGIANGYCARLAVKELNANGFAKKNGNYWDAYVWNLYDKHPKVFEALFPDFKQLLSGLNANKEN